MSNKKYCLFGFSVIWLNKITVSNCMTEVIPTARDLDENACSGRPALIQLYNCFA